MSPWTPAARAASASASSLAALAFSLLLQLGPLCCLLCAQVILSLPLALVVLRHRRRGGLVRCLLCVLRGVRWQGLLLRVEQGVQGAPEILRHRGG